MGELQQLLDSYKDKNIRPAFNYFPMRDLPLIGLRSATFDTEITKLKNQAEAAGRTLYILPINSWYRQRGNMIERKSLDLESGKLAGGRVPVLSSVVKINDTYNSENDPTSGLSYFAGSIPPDSDVVILDDKLVSGRTFRDAARFAEGCGARVVAFSVGSGRNIAARLPHTRALHLNHPYFSYMYGCLNGSATYAEAKEAYAALDNGEKQSFLNICAAWINPHLEKTGLTLFQLVPEELRVVLDLPDIHIHEDTQLQQTTVEALENRAKAGGALLSPAQVPEAARMHEQEELGKFIRFTRMPSNVVGQTTPDFSTLVRDGRAPPVLPNF